MMREKMDAIPYLNRDVEDFEFEHAGGNLDLDDLAYLMAEETLGDGGVDGDLACLQVGLALGNDGVGHLRLVLDILQVYLRQHLDGVGLDLRGVDDLGLADGQLQLVDLHLQHALCFLGGIVFSVF